MPSFRKGQWVSTSLKIVGAHADPAGRTIGIYHPAGTEMKPRGGIIPPGGSDFVVVEVPASVTIVAPDGQDLFGLVGREAKPVAFPPSELPDLRPVVEADHLPKPRRAHLPAGAKLPA